MDNQTKSPQISVNSGDTSSSKKRPTLFIIIGGIVVLIVVILYAGLWYLQSTGGSFSINTKGNYSNISFTNKTGPFLTRSQLLSTVPQYNSQTYTNFTALSYNERYVPQANLTSSFSSQLMGNYTSWALTLKPNVNGDYYLFSAGLSGLQLEEHVFISNSAPSTQQITSICNVFTKSFAKTFNQTGSTKAYVNGKPTQLNYSYNYYRGTISSTGNSNGMNFTYSTLNLTTNSSITNAATLCGFKNNKIVLFAMQTGFTGIGTAPQVNKTRLISYISSDLT